MENGGITVHLQKGGPFAIVTVDYEMPGMNGIQLIQNIRRLHLSPPPVIFGITGSGDESLTYSLLKSGAQDVFGKPLQKESFNTRVANALRLVQSQQELGEYVSMVDRYVIISETDLEGTTTYVSEAFCKISGFTQEELIGKNHRIVRHPEMPKEIYGELWKSIKAGDSWGGELKNRAKDGSAYWVEAHIEPILDHTGECIGYRGIRQDITDKKRVEELAITDRLTQLYNRIHLDHTLQKELAAFKRYGEPLSLILLDVDKFKSVNDTWGHQVGDSVLVETARVLKNHVRETDTLGRWGGEEFLIISPKTDLEGARLLAEKLRAAMESFAFTTVGQKTASFGVATFGAGDNEDKVVDRADKALYRAKEGGRNRVEVGMQ